MWRTSADYLSFPQAMKKVEASKILIEKSLNKHQDIALAIFIQEKEKITEQKN